MTDEFPNIINSSKGRPIEIESDRIKEWYKSVFQNFLKINNIQQHSRYTDKGPSIAERVIRTKRSLFKKPVLEKEKKTD